MLNAPKYGSFFRTEMSEMERRSGMAWSNSARSLFTMSAQRLRNRQVSSPSNPVWGKLISMCEDAQLKDEHMSHSFGNNVEIRHHFLGAIAEFEQSGRDRSPWVANLASFGLSVHLINLRSRVLGKNLRDSGMSLVRAGNNSSYIPRQRWSSCHVHSNPDPPLTRSNTPWILGQVNAWTRIRGIGE